MLTLTALTIPMTSFLDSYPMKWDTTLFSFPIWKKRFHVGISLPFPYDLRWSSFLLGNISCHQAWQRKMPITIICKSIPISAPVYYNCRTFAEICLVPVDLVHSIRLPPLPQSIPWTKLAYLFHPRFAYNHVPLLRSICHFRYFGNLLGIGNWSIKGVDGKYRWAKM